MVKKYITNNSSPFYFTNQTKELFKYYINSAKVLKIDYENVTLNYLIKQIKLNIEILENDNLTKDYFIDKNKKEGNKRTVYDEEFIIVPKSELKNKELLNQNPLIIQDQTQ
ncbi:UNVERIFIED_CONTAM: hypothetical protein O8I53_11205 [Campylobacter lari]